MELITLFEWMEASTLGQIGKTYGGVYAIGQSLHLMSLALLGGTVVVTDLRLLNVVLRDVPAEVIVENAHEWFKVGISMMIATGIFMAAAVAVRMYYNPFFWAKMTALAAGILFVFFIKYPLLRRTHAEVHPVVLKAMAVASLLLWFSVAATGRWVGFS